MGKLPPLRPQHVAEEESIEESLNCFVGVINIDLHEPSVLHSLEDQEYSGSNTPRDVIVIERDGRNGREEGEVASDEQEDPQHQPPRVTM